jgi:hypothetical protein
MAQMGHGIRRPVTAEQALQVAQASSIESLAEIDPNDPLGLCAGEWVTVTPDDYGRVPAARRLASPDPS